VTASGITAILVSYRRQSVLPRIFESLRATAGVTEIIVWNNNDEAPLRSEDGIVVINASRNFRAYARYAAALLAANDRILFQDDDVVIEPAVLEHLDGELQADPRRIYGIIGRNLEDGRYTGTAATGEVDIVLGQCMLFARELLASVYGDMLRLSPMARGDDIAFSLLTGVKHICRYSPRTLLATQNEDALWKDPDHFRLRQEMVDRVLALRHGRTEGAKPAAPGC